MDPEGKRSSRLLDIVNVLQPVAAALNGSNELPSLSSVTHILHYLSTRKTQTLYSYYLNDKDLNEEKVSALCVRLVTLFGVSAYTHTATA